mgnify:FL=1
MAEGYSIGTAWLQVAISGRGITSQVEKQLGDVDTAPAGRRITAGLGGALKGLGSIAAKALGAASAVGLGLGLADVTTQALAASDATQKFGSTLRFAGKGDAEIKALTASTKEYADRTVYSLGDIQNVTAQLAANGVTGYDKLAMAAGNLNAVAGGNAQTFSSVGMVLTQTAGAGKLTTENWNQLADAIPGASGRLQEAMAANGAYTGNFREAMEHGEITAAEFNQAIMDLGMTDVAQEAATSTTTMEGAWGNFEATLVSGATDLANRAMPYLTSALSAMSDGAQAAFDWISDTAIPSVQSLWDLLSRGDFTGPIFGMEEDSGFVDFLLSARDAAVDLADRLQGLAGWIVDNKDAIASFAVAAGTAVTVVKTWEAATTAWNTAAKAQAAIQAAGGLAQWVQTTKAAQAAQAAWNLVMSANPIMLLVTALAAAVAGLTYFFTQTETGKAIWASIVEAFHAFIDWVSTAWDAALTAVSTTWNTVWGAVSGFFQSYVVAPIQGAITTLSGWWDALASAVQTAWDKIRYAALAAIAILTAVVLTPLKIAVEALGAVFTWLWSNAVEPAWGALTGAIQTGWGSVIKPAWDAFTSALRAGYDTFIAPVFNAAVSLWTSVAASASAIWNGMSTTITAVFTAVSGFFSSIWATISGVFTSVWATISSTVSTYVNAVRNVITTVFTAVSTVVSTIWNTISSTISGVWTTISSTASSAVNSVKTTVTNTFDSMKNAVSKTFDAMKSAVDTAWSKVKGVAAKPVNFIIRTVYTNGIKKLAESIASKLGITLNLPSVSTISEYGAGGVIPGYAPGRDTVPALLSPGEAVLVPELVRRIGPERILAANYAASRRRPGGSPGFPAAGFSGGGVARFSEGGIVGWFKDAAKGVADFLADPIGAVTDLLLTPVNALIDSVTPAGIWSDIAKGAASKVLNLFPDWFKNKSEEVAPAGASGLVGAAMRAVAAHVPYVWGGSSIPPGLDCSGLVYWAAQQLGLGWPRLTAAGYQSASTPVASPAPGDLLFWGSPAHHVAIAAGGGMMIEEPRPGLSARYTAIWGSPTAGRYGGKYDDGGLLPPGLSTVMNATGRPERVLTDNQWNRLAARPAGLAPGTPVTMTLVDAAGSLLATLRGVVDRATGAASRTAVREMMGVR